MGILIELLVEVFGGLVPERFGTILFSVILSLACIAFAGLGALFTFYAFTSLDGLIRGLTIPVFFGLSYLCGRLAWKGFRSPD